MPGRSYKPEISGELEKNIKNGNTVFIVDCLCEDFIALLYKEIEKRKIENIKIWHGMGSLPDNDVLKLFNREQLNELMDLYRLYEFSDRVSVLSGSEQYGSLFNYVKTGILSMEELAEALLYRPDKPDTI